MTTHKNQVGQAGTGVNGGEFAKKTQTGDDVALIPQRPSAVERYAVPDWSPEEVQALLHTSRPRAIVLNPDPGHPVVAKRYENLSQTLEVESGWVTGGAYASLTPGEKRSVNAISAAIEKLHVLDKPVKKYEVSQLPTGNRAVYINFRYKGSPLDEVETRIEITPDGDVLDHRIAYLHGERYCECEDAADVLRFHTFQRVV